MKTYYNYYNTSKETYRSLSLFYTTVLVSLLIYQPVVYAIKHCPTEEGGGVCPDDSKCCKILINDDGFAANSPSSSSSSSSFSSGCIPNNPHLEGDGMCCNDNNMKPGLGTGCAGEYKCDSSIRRINDKNNNDNNDNGNDKNDVVIDYFCSLNQNDDHGMDATTNTTMSTTTTSSVTDQKLIMPRYELITSTSKQLKMYGYPLPSSSSSTPSTIRKTTKEEVTPTPNKERKGAIAYYSSMGPILTTKPNPNIDNNIQTVIFVIHGSGRNADEYIYSTMAVVAKSRLQDQYNEHNSSNDNVLVIAPRFLVMEDGVTSIPVPIGDDNDYDDDNGNGNDNDNDNDTKELNTIMMQPILWNETDPIPHTWRYGANAISPFTNISSYDVMDTLVEHFTSSGERRRRRRYGNLERIVVIGHSAGGQFTQRWAMTSNSQAWGDDVDTDDNYKIITKIESSSVAKQQLRKLYINKETNMNTNINSNRPILLKVVAANPRSFCYLDKRRFINNNNGTKIGTTTTTTTTTAAAMTTPPVYQYQIPPLDMITKCPNYNKWEWGLDYGGRLPTPYKDNAIHYFNGNISKLSYRYAYRNVVYLSGNNDTDHLRSSCEDDDFQGRFRRERSELFFKSLNEYFGSSSQHVHSRLVVDDVGHDHSLMFGSKEGIEAIFG